MKNLFYILSLVLCLTACGEKPEEKAFIDKNVREFLEYLDIADTIADTTPRIYLSNNLSNALLKMAEIKLQIESYKFSPKCNKSKEYIVKNMKAIQDIFKSIAKGENEIYVSVAEDNLEEILNHNSCETITKSNAYADYLGELLLSETNNDNPDIVKIKNLIKNGANVNFNIHNLLAINLAINNSIRGLLKVQEHTTIFANAALRHHMVSPLFGASISPAKNSTKIVELLLKNGANINDTDLFARTPLHYAVKILNDNDANRIQIISLLIKFGADVNAKDEFGNTPLQVALQLNENEITPQIVKIVKLLIENNADVNNENKSYQTALRMVRESFPSTSPEKYQIIKLLEEHGAK